MRGVRGTQKACENTCPAVPINVLGVGFRHKKEKGKRKGKKKRGEKLSTSKLSVLFIHEDVL